jgi:predicted DCC family thiol-disulfide oxidoreductase YuxK
VILFDGVCNLCNAWVQWLVKRDRAGLYRYASLQSVAARELLSTRLTEDQMSEIPDSIVLVDRAGVHTLSTAVLRVLGGLGPPWRALRVLLVVPRFVRDFVYRFVASHRYRWFGRQATSLVPAPEIACRFLDASEVPDEDSVDPHPRFS